MCDIAYNAHSRRYREFMVSEDIGIPVAASIVTVCEALGSMPVMAGVQIHVSHVLGTFLSSETLSFRAQFYGDSIRSICAPTFFKLFFYSFFKLCFLFLKGFPFSEPGVISCSINFQHFGPLRHRIFGIILYKSVFYFWCFVK